MSLTFIDTNKLPRVASVGGVTSSEVLSNALCGAENVTGTLRWIEPGGQLKLSAKDRHQLVYLMEGAGVIRLGGKDYAVEKGAGVYLDPGESAEVLTTDRPVKVFHLEVLRVPENWSSRPKSQ